MAKVSRKAYKLDTEIIARLATIMCSYEEIAMVVDTTVDNFKKRYSDIIEKAEQMARKVCEELSMKRQLWKKTQECLYS